VGWFAPRTVSLELDSKSLPPLTRLVRVIGLLGLEAASTGLGAWALFSRNALASYAHDNDLGPPQRRFVFVAMVGGLALAFLFATVVFVRQGAAGLDLVERVARRLSPLAVVGLVPFLLVRSVWIGWDLVVLPLVLAVSWGLSAAVRLRLETEPIFSRGALDRWRTLGLSIASRASVRAARISAPLLAVLLGALGYAVYFSAFTILRHRNLGTASFDLGLEDNLMWHVVHGGLPLFRSTPFSGPNGTHFGNHATFFSYLLAPFYLLKQGPETLLVIQAVLMGAAAVPLFLYARRHLPPWTAVLVAFAYLFYPPLHGANLYDFHYLPLAVFFLWLALYAIETDQRVLAAVSVVLALSVREDVAACLGAVGLFLVLRGTAARAGAIVAAVGLGYFLIMKMAIMPAVAGGQESFVNQYVGLLPEGERSFGGVLETVLANPAFTANVILSREKATYFLELFVPLMFLPLTRPIGLWLIAPGVFFTLLATAYPPLYLPSFQYTSYWTSFAFIGLVVALEHAGRARYPDEPGGPIRRKALVAGLVAATLACTYLDGAILRRDQVRGGFGRFDLMTTEADLHNRRVLAELIAEIPRDAKVVASERLVPHVSTRSDAYSLRHDTFDADWLLFELPLPTPEHEHAAAPLTIGTFGVVDDRGSFVLAKRGAAIARNGAVLIRM
jgi:uncharacterized membrane protein